MGRPHREGGQHWRIGGFLRLREEGHFRPEEQPEQLHRGVKFQHGFRKQGSLVQQTLREMAGQEVT